jgi:excisionase family DNA binding protein
MDATEVKPTSHLLTIPAAARLLGISDDLLYRAVKSGQIPTVQVGTRRFVARTTVDLMLAGWQPDVNGAAKKS